MHYKELMLKVSKQFKLLSTIVNSVESDANLSFLLVVKGANSKKKMKMSSAGP